MIETQIPQEDLERILRSKTFAAAPSSRRLLRYLAEKSSAENPELKEYSVGIDVFGKPPEYDPQRDSTVRIQVGRLRQKLTEYYGNEGQSDSLIFDIPKGAYRVAISARQSLAGDSELLRPLDAPAKARLPWKPLAAGATAGVVAALLCVSLYILIAPGTRAGAAWNADLEKIWHPMLEGRQPLLISVATPMFVEFRHDLLFRERSVDQWEKALTSPNVAAVGKALGLPASRPSYYYAAAGEVGAAFALAKALGPRKENLSLVRDVQLTWEQIADNHVVFLGPPRFFRSRLGEMPTTLEILAGPEGFRVLHPRTGEQELYGSKGAQGEGESYALITHSPGPGGRGEILSIMSNDTWAREGAALAFTDPGFAQRLVARLEAPSGKFPRLYQVLLRLRLKGGVATETLYVLHRELHAGSEPGPR